MRKPAIIWQRQAIIAFIILFRSGAHCALQPAIGVAKARDLEHLASEIASLTMKEWELSAKAPIDTTGPYFPKERIVEAIPSPKGRWVYFTTLVKAGGLEHWLLEVPVDANKQFPPPARLPMRASWLPNGELFIGGRTYEPASKLWEGKQPCADDAGIVEDIQWAANGNYGGYLKRDGQRHRSPEQLRPGAPTGTIYRLVNKDPEQTEPGGALMLYDRVAGKERQISPEAMRVVNFDFNPTGSLVVVEGFDADDVNRYGNRRTKLFLIDIRTLECKRMTSLDGVDEHDPKWSPDGRSIAFLLFEAEEAIFARFTKTVGPHVAITGRDGTDLKRFAEIDTSVTGLNWTPDGSAITLEGAVRDFSPYRLRLDITTGKIDWIPLGDASAPTSRVSWVAGSSNFRTKLGPYEVFPEETPTKTKEWFLAKVGNNGESLERRRLPIGDDVRDYGGEVKTEVVHWRSPDDKYQIEGLLLTPRRPAGSEERFPAILSIPGGPGCFNASFGGAHWGTELALTLRGYAVLLPFTRGRAGRSIELANGIGSEGSRHEVPLADAIAGFDMLIASGRIDPRRTGIFGHSYGGGLVEYAVTVTSRFKAMVDHDSGSLSLVNDITNPGRTVGSGPLLQKYYYGMSEFPAASEVKRMIRESPALNVINEDTPALTIASLRNHDMTAIYHLRKKLGIPAMHIQYDMSHAPDSTLQAAEQIQWTVEWFDYFIKGEVPENVAHREEIIAARRPN